MQLNRTVSVQHCFRELEATGRFTDLRLIEAAAYILAKQKDKALEAYVDRMIDREVAGAERRITNPDQVVRMNGYFFEAVVAWYHATGKRKMLDTAIKALRGPRRRAAAALTRLIPMSSKIRNTPIPCQRFQTILSLSRSLTRRSGFSPIRKAFPPQEQGKS